MIIELLLSAALSDHESITVEEVEISGRCARAIHLIIEWNNDHFDRQDYWGYFDETELRFHCADRADGVIVITAYQPDAAFGGSAAYTIETEQWSVVSHIPQR